MIEERSTNDNRINTSKEEEKSWFMKECRKEK